MTTTRCTVVGVVTFGVALGLFIAAGMIVPVKISLPASFDYAGVAVLQSEFSAGSGFVFAEDESFYYVATAQHVVEGVAEIEVDGIPSKVVAEDPIGDVAIVRVKKNKIVYPVYSFNHDVVLGDHVHAVGYTWGNGDDADPTFMVYYGRVTCLNWDECLSSNSGVFPGMSGGPLFNENNEVVGITSRVGVAWGCVIDTLSIFVPADQLTRLWNEYRSVGNSQ